MSCQQVVALDSVVVGVASDFDKVIETICPLGHPFAALPCTTRWSGKTGSKPTSCAVTRKNKLKEKGTINRPVAASGPLAGSTGPASRDSALGGTARERRSPQAMAKRSLLTMNPSLHVFPGSAEFLQLQDLPSLSFVDSATCQ